MKKTFPKISPPSSLRGSALIIALAVMVIVFALVVGILSRVTTERLAAKGYASSIEAKLLADTAVQLVQAQIGVATSGGTTNAWSSQPGLIRTFDQDGKPAGSYKLYSSGTMQVKGALVPSQEAAELENWFAQPAHFTDLNQPVDANLDGTPDTWPILDPSANDMVEGFQISDDAPVGTHQGVNNPAPMPVRWLYVLQDGQLVAATGTGSTATVAGASAQNPIVGRVAFWTDDETCKVNINTASEGTYWDIPRARTKQERDLARYQPTRNEFQAYPGHPATTSISAVFPNLTMQEIMQIIPRVEFGGSEGGTKDYETAQKVLLDQDRLFANEEELLFKPDRATSNSFDKDRLEKAKFFITAISRAPETNLFNLPKVSVWPVHAMNDDSHRTSYDRLLAFCATLNGQPYYFQRQNSQSGTEDYEAIGRNKTLYQYLQDLMERPVPGFGAVLANKFNTDSDQILTEIFDYIRCTNILDRNLLETGNRYAAGIGNAGDAPARGEVVPIKIGENTRGSGRYVTISEAAIWMICSADATVEESNTADNLTLVPPGDANEKPLKETENTKEIRIELALLLEPFCPMLSVASLRPDIEILVEGLENWTIQGNGGGNAVPLGLPSKAQQTYTEAGRYLLGKSPSWTNDNNNWGGHMGFKWALNGAGILPRQIRARNNGRLTVSPTRFAAKENSSPQPNCQYPFVSEPVTVTVLKDDPKVRLNAGLIKVIIKQRTANDNEPIQTIELDFSKLPNELPAPGMYWEKGLIPGYYWTFQADGCGMDDVPSPTDLSADQISRRFRAFKEGYYSTNQGVKVFKDADVIYSLVPATASGKTGDPKLLAMMDTVPKGFFEPHPLANGSNRMANSLIHLATGGLERMGGENGGALADLGGQLHPSNKPSPKAPFSQSDSYLTGDWDNGPADQPDGGYLNAPDGGNQSTKSGFYPYFTMHAGTEVTFTSPSRVIPSPVAFGSLPTGVKRNRHWETLLFRRQPGHPNYPVDAGEFIKNPDYLLLDLFWMPVVEPYAISEPFSTAGKINMNYQIVPFTYIDRSTGLYAVLKKEKVIGIPADDVGSYKSATTSDISETSFPSKIYRHNVNIPATLTQFTQRFTNADNTDLYAFRTAAEICDIHIIPENASVNTASKAALDNSMATYWTDHALTGDNSRERIYATVYPRLTTRSNTFTVHFRAQSLQKRAGSEPDVWEEGKDVIQGEYRGSTTIERYLDPNNPAIPDYAKEPDATPSLDSLYRWRMRTHRQFAP